MAKITIKELYYGDKYAVMSEVFKTMFLASPNKAGVDEQTALELEIVRQTLIAVEKMKKNGDCIAEGELGDTVTVSIIGTEGDHVAESTKSKVNDKAEET